MRKWKKFKVTYRDLMKIIVCDIENMECMVHKCENCPGSDALHTYLQKKFKEYDVDDDITFSQWDSTDRTALRTCTAPAEDFLEQLVYKIDKLTTHSFIAKSQARYLKTRKAEMDDTSCLILLDFAENHHYVVQDEVQGRHWNKEQCRLHPVVLYYKDDNKEVQCTSLCFLSSDLEHDTSVVFELQ